MISIKAITIMVVIIVGILHFLYLEAKVVKLIFEILIPYILSIGSLIE